MSVKRSSFGQVFQSRRPFPVFASAIQISRVCPPSKPALRSPSGSAVSGSRLRRHHGRLGGGAKGVPGRRMKAMRLPSGDQTGEPSWSTLGAMYRTVCDSASYTAMKAWSSRWLTKAIRFESGDQTGPPLRPKAVTSGRAVSGSKPARARGSTGARWIWPSFV